MGITHVATALLASLAMTSVSAETFYFTYQGFNNFYSYADGSASGNSFYDPNDQLSGSFTVEDLNQDGRYLSDELVQLTIRGMDFGNTPCVYGSSTCVSAFHYDPNFNGLNMEGKYLYTINGNVAYFEIITGHAYIEAVKLPGAQGYDQHYHVWQETTQVISTSQVPEPSAAILLSLGLGLVMIGACRRW